MHSDRQVAVAALDKKARFEALVRTHQQGVWRYLRFIGATRLEAEDLTQETFLAVWKSGFEEFSDAASASYFRAAARSRFLMMLRTKGRRPRESDLAEVDADWVMLGSEDPEVWDERIEVMLRCLQQVQGKAREALDLFYRDEVPQAQIAAKLGMKPEGVKTLLRRAVEKLRECMEAKLKWKSGKTE